MQFRCSGAQVTLPTPDARARVDIRRTYRVYREMLHLNPRQARRRLVFVIDR